MANQRFLIWSHANSGKEPTRFQTKKGVKIGKYQVKIDRVHCGPGFYCYTHSLTQTDSIVAYASLGSKLQKWKRNYFVSFKRQIFISSINSYQFNCQIVTSCLGIARSY